MGEEDYKKKMKHKIDPPKTNEFKIGDNDFNKNLVPSDIKFDDKPKPKKIVPKEVDSDMTDEDEVPKMIQAEYQWRVQKAISNEQDEFNITHIKIPWSGEDVMQQINPKFFLFDWKSLIHFSRIIKDYNWSA